MKKIEKAKNSEWKYVYEKSESNQNEFLNINQSI